MNLKDNFTEFRENIVNLIEAKIELVKIDFQEKTESIVVKVMYVAILALLILLVLVFCSVLLAILLNHWLKSDYLGFVIMSLLFIIKLAIWFFARKPVINMLKTAAAKVVDAEIDTIKKYKPLSQ